MNMLAMVFLWIGIVVALIGWYEARLQAMEKNPVTRTRIIPRTMYDDIMGVDWSIQN